MGDVVGGRTLARTADEAAPRHAPDETPAPAGFAYAPNLLSEDEEIALVDELDTLEFVDMRPVGGTAERSARRYGGDVEPLPDWLLPAREHAAALAGLEPEELGTVVIARYPEGCGSGWHRDRRADGTTVGVTLAAPTCVRFRRNVAGRHEAWQAELAPGSGHVLTGPARTHWQRLVAPAQSLRYALTFATGARRAEQA